MRRTGIAIAGLMAVGAFASVAGAATKERGAFATLPAGTSLGLSLAGMAQITRTADGTSVKITVRGLEPGTTYGAHLHNAPCAVNEGGAHYKDNPAGLSTPPNELWLSSTSDPMAGITANAAGVGAGPRQRRLGRTPGGRSRGDPCDPAGRHHGRRTEDRLRGPGLTP